jgi:hypothetical protein
MGENKTPARKRPETRGLMTAAFRRFAQEADMSE